MFKYKCEILLAIHQNFNPSSKNAIIKCNTTFKQKLNVSLGQNVNSKFELRSLSANSVHFYIIYTIWKNDSLNHLEMFTYFPPTKSNKNQRLGRLLQGLLNKNFRFDSSSRFSKQQMH